MANKHGKCDKNVEIMSNKASRLELPKAKTTPIDISKKKPELSNI